MLRRASRLVQSHQSLHTQGLEYTKNLDVQSGPTGMIMMMILVIKMHQPFGP